MFQYRANFLPPRVQLLLVHCRPRQLQRKRRWMRQEAVGKDKRQVYRLSIRFRSWLHSRLKQPQTLHQQVVKKTFHLLLQLIVELWARLLKFSESFHWRTLRLRLIIPHVWRGFTKTAMMILQIRKRTTTSWSFPFQIHLSQHQSM